MAVEEIIPLSLPKDKRFLVVWKADRIWPDTPCSYPHYVDLKNRRAYLGHRAGP